MLGKLQSYKLQPTKFYEKGHRLVECGFDGAAAMSSENVGVAAVMKRKIHTAIFITCMP